MNSRIFVPLLVEMKHTCIIVSECLCMLNNGMSGWIYKSTVEITATKLEFSEVVQGDKNLCHKPGED